VIAPLPVRAPLAAHEAQAAELRRAFAAGDDRARAVVRARHPRFLDAEVTWRPRALAAGELEAATFDDDDARLVVARAHDYRDWAALRAHVLAVAVAGSPVRAFELAVEAVVDGDVEGLARMVAADPSLVRARSTRVCCFDPPVHGATLLHYLAANGVEGHRQRTAARAVEVARALVAAGAEVDALAWMYGGAYATVGLLVSSSPPAEAGLQVPILHALLDAGASVDGVGGPRAGSNLRTALAFGFVDAAEALAVRGATIDVAAAAGLGRDADVARLLPAASAADRHAALALAAMLGRVEVVRRLLDAGEDPDRCQPEGLHAHATPLHHAALHGHLDVVRLLVERGARLDVHDRLWDGTPLGWARHGGQAAAAALLEEAARARGAGA
jgi:hypothetical protein